MGSVLDPNNNSMGGIASRIPLGCYGKPEAFRSVLQSRNVYEARSPFLSRYHLSPHRLAQDYLSCFGRRPGGLGMRLL